MDFKGIIKWGAIAGGAYLLYDWFTGGQGLSALFGTATPQAGTTTTVPPSKTPVIDAAAVADTRSLMLKAATGDTNVTGGMATVHVWNYYYSKVRGVSLPPGIDVGAFPEGYKMSIDQWMALANKYGFSGLGRLMSGNYVRVPAFRAFGRFGRGPRLVN